MLPSTRDILLTFYVMSLQSPFILLSLLIMSESHRRCSSSSSSSPRSPSPPSQTYYPSILSMPTPALVESAAGGAHYSGVKVDSEMFLKHRRNNSFKRHMEIKHYHQRILDDLTELYCCRPTREIFERSWHRDAEFEVHSLSYPVRVI
jgi:DNA-directed RNA polymerase subunit N (RpoN/RPB10)